MGQRKRSVAIMARYKKIIKVASGPRLNEFLLNIKLRSDLPMVLFKIYKF